MALTDYVTLSITQNTVGVSRLGFGTGLLISYTAAWAERTRTYGQYTDVLVDFPTTTGPEARGALAYFSQSPAPTSLIIGRGANKPTKIVQLSALTPTANITYTYQVAVKGTGFVDTTVSFVSDATPTDAEYAAGMVAALNGVASKNYTAAGASSPITITGNTAGAWFSVEVLDVNYQTTTETTTDPGVVADLTAITSENPTWYGLHSDFNSTVIGTALAASIEAQSKIYIAQSNDTRTVTTAIGAGDLCDAGRINAYTRTLMFYHRSPGSMAGAALLGKCLSFDPGAETWAFKTLAGVPTFAMSGTHRANIVARNANSYESVAGVNITFNGQTGNGGYLDTRRGLDWIQDDMSKSIFAALAGNPKIPYTDPGIAVIQSLVEGTLKRGADRGIVVESTILTKVPKAANVPSADKTSRTLNSVQFSFTYQGAVQKINVVGTASA